MKLKINYEDEAVSLPGAVISKLDRASKRDMKLLFLLAASFERRVEFEAHRAEIIAHLSCTDAELNSSIAFWRGAGILDICEDADNIISESEEKHTAEADNSGGTLTAVPERKPELPDELPLYTTAELNELLEKDRPLSLLIDECQRIVGDIFNPREVSVVIGLFDYLKLDADYILTLTDYCVRKGKKSLQYIKKRAFAFYDDGVIDSATLHEMIRKLDAADGVEADVRKLFGMKDRSLTTKEKKFLTKWANDYGYGIDIIKKAYETTVDAINKPSVSYADAIMKRWHEEGLNELSAIEAAQNEKLPQDGSFDTDDFFENALKRSFKN